MKNKHYLIVLIALTVIIGLVIYILKIEDSRAIVSLVGIPLAIISLFFNHKHAQNLENVKADLVKERNADLENLKSDLTDLRNDKNAYREYKYEALKRLYKECQPLVFQLLETLEGATYRVQNIASKAKRNELEKEFYSQYNDQNYPNNEYYFLSSIYYLFAPLAIFKIMRKKVTLMDLTLDEDFDFLDYYQLSKQMYLSYTDDFAISKGLNYEPNHEEWREKRYEDPKVYWRQGFPSGVLSILEDFLIDDNKENILTYGEFEKKVKEDNGYIRHQIRELAFDVFRQFTPDNRPVLWRILLTQAYLYNLILNRKDKKESLSVFRCPNKSEFIWYDDRESGAIDDEFEVIQKYLKNNLHLSDKISVEWREIKKDVHNESK